MPKKPSKPHDEFFKAAFSQKDVALDYLQKMLPAALLEKLDLRKIKRINGSFVSPSLREFFSDVAYQCPLLDSEKQVMVSFILEHKSSPESRPHLQLLRYMLDSWEEQLKQKKDLTLIIPIIIYHGEENWHQRDLSSYFGEQIPESFKAYLPEFDYIFTHVTAMSDAQILALGKGLLVNAFLMLKHIHTPEYILHNPQVIFVNLTEPGSPRDFIVAILAYFLKNTELAQEKIQTFIKTLPNVLNQTAMSTYEMILEEGRKKEREVSHIMLEKALQREQLERQKAEEERQRAEEEHQRAEEEHQRAEEERQRLNNVILYLFETAQLPVEEIAIVTNREVDYIEALIAQKNLEE